jgi:hypothetical protein
MTDAAPELNPEWLDMMVKKLITVLEAQLVAVAKADPEAGDAKSRAADARTLSALERTLDRLSRLERERAAVREKKVARHDESERQALERRLDKRLAAIRKSATAKKP